MIELKNNEVVNLTNGNTAKVIKELGRGGQGIVYEVEVAGNKMALKWYMKAPSNKFYKNLEENIASGAPSPAFLWPEYLTQKQKGSFGYVMKLRPTEYKEFGQYLLARARFQSFEAVVNAAMKICEGFKDLHLRGLSYQDLNDGNFFIHPVSGDVLICDNDNVMPDGDRSGILGKARYMAPEIVTGKEMPNKYTDRYSLSVILFMLFYFNHPLEGERVCACPCLTESYEKKFYGEEPIFIYDENNSTNRPVRGVHNNIMKRWPAFPSILRETFKVEFSEDGLKNPSKRLLEMQWQDIIQKLRDMLVVCPNCKHETFVEQSGNVKCMDCGASFQIAGQIDMNGRKVVLTPKTKVYLDKDNKPDAEVIVVPGDRYPVQLKNITTQSWTVETPSGKVRSVDPGCCMPVKAGLKVRFIGSIKGIII